MLQQQRKAEPSSQLVLAVLNVSNQVCTGSQSVTMTTKIPESQGILKCNHDYQDTKILRDPKVQP